MQVGVKVQSEKYPDKGIGVIVEVQEIFGEKYARVFFEKNGEVVYEPIVNLKIFESPEEKFKNSHFSEATFFMLRFYKDKIKAMATLEGIQTAGNFRILPLPHQLLAVSFVMERIEPRALIADEVGLGKTIEAALIYEELKMRDLVSKVLIIAPSGLCRQWQEELRDKFFEDFTIYDKNMVLTLKQLYGENTNVWTLSPRIITSIDFIKPQRITPELSSTVRSREWHNKEIFQAAIDAGFDMVIIDEAHKLTKDMAGDETARFKVGKAFSEAVHVFLLLTATPHQGDTAKFKNLLSLIDPYSFYKNSDITPEKVRTVTVRNNKRAAVDLDGKRLFKQRITSLCVIERDPVRDKVELDLYKSVTDYVSDFYNIAEAQKNGPMMFLLMAYQRMVSSSSRAVLKSLSARLESLKEIKSKYLDLINQGRKNQENLMDRLNELDILEYEDLEDINEEETFKYWAFKNIKYLDIEISQLEHCVELARKACLGKNDAKLIKLLEITNELKIRENNPNLKFIIFTEFIETQNYIRACLENLGYKVALINGKMSSEEKIEQKRYFQDEAQFLVSTDAGGEGINLHFCWILINYDLPWNPMRLEQRIGRIDRIGQERDVLIINFQLYDTVEQHVRDVIESKLEIVRNEFNDGEDKLADILSTLQDEFSFEKIYVDAVRKRYKDVSELEDLSRRIYEKAKKIIQEGQLILPFSNLEEKYKITQYEIRKKNEKVKKLLERYVQCFGGEIREYKKKEGTYYFEDPVSGKRIGPVIFDPALSLQNDNCELMSLQHPYIKNLIENLDETLVDKSAAKLQIKEKKFEGIRGFLFIYTLSINNHIDQKYEYPIMSFIDNCGYYSHRISQYFQENEDITASELITGKIDIPFQNIVTVAYNKAMERAEGIYFDKKVEIEQKLLKLERKMEKYYLDKEKAIGKIVIENIKGSKIKELYENKKKMMESISQRKLLFPELKCQQIAYVEFVP
jgi:superfamily II DNA or RNA helicase